MPTLTRAERVAQRNQRICDAFYQRYTNLPRAQKPAREQVVQQLADEHYLSTVTVERIVLPKAA